MKRDDPDVYRVDPIEALPYPPEAIIEVLRPMVTEPRFEKIIKVISRRTLRIAVVLDDITDPHNVSAVMRSMEAMGIQNLYWVQGLRDLHAARVVSKRTDQWLSICRFIDAETAVQALRRDGYRVMIASMEGELEPQSLASKLARDRALKIALVFGNEHRGVSEALRTLADGVFQIPMVGFVESLNISVAAAITIHTLRRAVNAETLDEKHATQLCAQFLMNSVHDSNAILRNQLNSIA